MPVQCLSPRDVTILAKPGITSEQLMWQGNSPDAAVTLTRVTMAPGATSEPHAHAGSEQTWLVERGLGQLLGEDGPGHELRQGDIVRTPAGDIHGVTNIGTEPFVYVSVTTPPVDFRYAYENANPATADR